MIAERTIWFAAPPIFCALVPLLCIPAADWMAVAPRGNVSFLWLALLLVFPALAAVPVLFVTLFGVAIPRFRRKAAMLGLCSAAYLVAFVVSIRIGQEVRMSAFKSLADRSQTLIAAIRAYEEKHGRPPESLPALVPDFLPAVPSTGMGAYPEYRYFPRATNYRGNPWVITVYTPSGGINFDQFMYFPLTNYPTQGYGGWLERVGDWAYVHE